MARLIECLQCGALLNLPAQTAGRRLKCPKCGAKFLASEEGVSRAPYEPQNGADRNADSTLLLIKNLTATDMPVMPKADGDLRETFDLPMMTGSANASLGPSTGSANVSDAHSLLNDRPVARRKTGAEARAEARRCPTCGGLVPVGMSICQTCGFDLDTGQRVGLDDVFAPPKVQRAQEMPIPIAIVGGLSLALSVGLTILAMVKWFQQTEGAIYFIPVALFGVYSAAQFLRGKTFKLLLASMTLGALIALIGLIALPVYSAQTQSNVVQRSDLGDDPDAVDALIRPITEGLDYASLYRGFAVLFLYTVISIYLLSPQVSRHFRK
ncbi:MAG: hypothetical protein NVSMB9_01150 [Isosphaeraceae bacterium]